MKGHPKDHLFKSFTGLTVEEFDGIFQKEITKRYGKHEIKRLSERKNNREKEPGAGRSFKLDLKNIFQYSLCTIVSILLTLNGFLFDSDQITIYRNIQKLEGLIRKCVPLPQKLCSIAKRLKTT